MLDLLTVIFMLPIVYAAHLEFKDVGYKEHFLTSTMTAVIVAVLFIIPAMLAQLGYTSPLTIYGITLPAEWSLLLVVVALLVNFLIYWVVVIVTKFVEVLVKGV